MHLLYLLHKKNPFEIFINSIEFEQQMTEETRRNNNSTSSIKYNATMAQTDLKSNGALKWEDIINPRISLNHNNCILVYHLQKQLLMHSSTFSCKTVYRIYTEWCHVKVRGEQLEWSERTKRLQSFKLLLQPW